MPGPPPELKEVTATATPHGTINHQIQLAQPVTGIAITATYTDGVLTLTVPLATARPQHRHDTRWPHPLPHAA